jgi:hypothetical protein
MGFQIASLIGGMAAGATSRLEEEEKQGRKFGEFAFSTLYDNYKTSKKDYDERQNLYIDTATKLREFSNNYGYNVSEGELKEAISSPAFVSEFSRAMQKPDFDPSKVEWQKLFSKVDKTKAGEFTGNVEDFIKGEFKMPTATSVAEGALPTQKSTSGFFGVAREKAYSKTLEGAAKASGVPMENLMGASGITPKTTIAGSKSQFEFGAFRPMDVKDIAAQLAKERYQITTEENPSPDQAQRLARNEQNTLRLKEAITSVDPNADSFTTMKSNALTALAHAKQTNDPAVVKKATDKLTNIMETEYIAESMFGKAESHEKAMARLESVAVKISNMPKGPERTQLEEMNDAEMKTRASFVKKMREASGLSEGEKDRQVGLATLAAMTRRVIFQEMLPAGAISTQADGSFTINSLPGVKDEQIKSAALATQERLIKMLTKDGVPVDNASKQILMANSVNFDGSGRAVVNSSLGSPSSSPPSISPTAAPTMLSQPAVKATPQAAPAAAPVATPTKPGIDIAAERQRASNAIAQGAPADKIKAIFKQKTGQDY